MQEAKEGAYVTSKGARLVNPLQIQIYEIGSYKLVASTDLQNLRYSFDYWVSWTVQAGLVRPDVDQSMPWAMRTWLWQATTAMTSVPAGCIYAGLVKKMQL